MKTKLIAFFILSAFLFSAAISSAQNWQYVGPKNINNSVGFSTYLYFADLEVNSAGDAFVGYWEYSGMVKFAKYTAGSWTQFPSIGTFTANYVDVEVSGTNYYIAYSRVKSGNMYAYVQKYNGTNWTQIGDSLLLGNSGSGGWFDFLLDNTGVPTLLGAVNTVLLSDKKMMQYNGTNWTTAYTFPGSAATILRENSGTFSSLNKLFCVTQGVFPLTTKYYTVVSKVDGGVQTTIGDTIFRQVSTHKLKLNASDVPHLGFYNTIGSKIFAYKLNGASWNFIGDTTSASVGALLYADINSTGNFVFNTQQANMYKSIYYHSANTRASMDTLNITNTSLLGVNDLVIPPGSGDVYALVLELKPSFAQDLSVMKHTAPGSIGINEMGIPNKSLLVYPNPSNGNFTINKKHLKGEAIIKIYSALGNLIYQNTILNEQETIDLSAEAKGLYLIKTISGNEIYTNRIVVE